MAHFVMTNAKLSIGGTDLSDHVKTIKVTPSVEILDATHMGLGGRARLPGLKDCRAEVELYQDEASSEVMATLFPLLGVETAVAMREVNDTISATNPEYQFNGLIDQIPIGGEVGAVAMVTFTIQLSDGTPLVRDTTP